MRLNSESVEFEVLAAGTYAARIVQIVELGVQPGGEYKGQKQADVPVFHVTFELPEVTRTNREGDEVTAKETMFINVTSGKKAKLTHLAKAAGIENLRDYDSSEFLNKPVLLTIEHQQKGDRIKTFVASTTRLPQGLANSLPPASTEVKYFSFSDPDVEVFNSLGDGLKNMMTRALNYSGSKVEKLINTSVSKTDDSGIEDSGIV